jgi:3-phosphoshikimate 1-carboxyvinyltransferase
VALERGGTLKPYALEVRASHLGGAIEVPASKSVTHRSFLLAAQAIQPCTVVNPLLSADTRATLAGLLQFGARFHLDADRPDLLQFIPVRLAAPRQPIDCANSGTTLRLFAGLAARFGQPTTLTGDASLQQRPNGDLLRALRSLGATIDDQAGRAPLTVRGPIRSGLVQLPGPTSSQFASSLLLSLPFVEGASTLAMNAPISSSPYLDVTLDVLNRAGLRVTEAHGPGREFSIPGSQVVQATRLQVDGDWSSAAFLLVAAAITNSSLELTGLDPRSRQGDRAILGLLQQFGAKVAATDQGARITGAELQGVTNVDVQATPDLFPPLVVLAACSRGQTRFVGGAALRTKETDRIAAMAQGLAAMGIEVQEQPDGLVVRGGRLRGAKVQSRGDHRIHMAFAVAGLAAEGLTVVDEPHLADVSFPGFHAALEAAGASFTLLQGHRAQVSS